MNLSKLITFILTAIFLTSQLARAEETVKTPRHEIGLGVNPLLGFAGSTTGGDLYTDLSGTLAVSVSVTYKYALFKFLQVGIDPSLGYYKQTTAGIASSITAFQLVGGPTFNIPFGDDWLFNSLFVSTYGGFVLLDTAGGSSRTKGALEGTIGYRIGLTDHFVWRPNIGTFKILDGSKFLFFARPINFSILF